MPEIAKENYKVKTQSQKMRAILFLVWETTATNVDFESWYKAETEKIISHYKKKLN